ncbi:MAG: hypothetical protein K0S65_1550, partial [Labilithrix sp.]|nr:hypothetical protein [Labilithrix sp.]
PRFDLVAKRVSEVGLVGVQRSAVTTRRVEAGFECFGPGRGLRVARPAGNDERDDEADPEEHAIQCASHRSSVEAAYGRRGVANRRTLYGRAAKRGGPRTGEDVLETEQGASVQPSARRPRLELRRGWLPMSGSTRNCMSPSAVRPFPSSRRVGAIGFVLSFAVLLVAERTARGADEPESGWSLDDLDRHLAFVWEAPEECPAEGAVRERIRSLLRTRGEATRRLRARATVTPTQHAYSLELAFEDGRTRVLTSETCIGLVEATSIILALDIETHLKQPPPAAVPSVKAARAEPLPAAKVKPSAPSRPVRFAASARVLVDVGSLPRPTSGYRATFLLGYDTWSAEAAATAFVPRDADGARQGTGAHVGLSTGGLRICRSWSMGRGVVALGACLGGEAGSSTVTGFGITRPNTSAGLWMSVLAASELRVLWNRALPLILGFEVGAVPSRTQAVIQGPGTIFDPAPWLVRGTLGLELDFFSSPRME